MVRILIADDHQFVRANLRELLARQQPQWAVSEAANGRDAIEAFRKDMPDVAVLDIVMEPVGGGHLLRVPRTSFLQLHLHRLAVS